MPMAESKFFFTEVDSTHASICPLAGDSIFLTVAREV